MSAQFVCVKWGKKYPADYVNRLYSMISRQMSSNFTLYCLTDDSEGFFPQIRPLPILDSTLTGWGHKLSLFKDDFHGLSGDLLYMDLDVVVTGKLDDFFTYKPGSFLITKDLKTGAYNSSVFRYTVGSQPQIWQSFLEDPEAVTKIYHGDQDWITEKVKNAELWPEQWVVSFKKQCHARIEHSYGRIGVLLRKLGLMKVKGDAVIPDGARVVQFHGKPDPEDVMDGPYDIYRQALWIKDYWY